jgi:hypothetical protein
VPRGAQLRPRGAQARRADEGADSSDHRAAEAAHPDAKIALRYCNELELLVAVMLSAQTTDVNVNRVTETLFEKYRRPEDYLAVLARGARARHLSHGLLPPEGEGATRDDADAAERVRRQGPANELRLSSRR